MKKKVLAAILVAAGILVGCGQQDTSGAHTLEAEPIVKESEAETAEESTEEVVDPNAPATITERKVVDGGMSQKFIC